MDDWIKDNPLVIEAQEKIDEQVEQVEAITETAQHQLTEHRVAVLEARVDQLVGIVSELTGIIRLLNRR
jgi:predicted dinucleotide-utilizing enzyme